MSDFLKPNYKGLEIGVGTKFTSNYLKSKNFKIKTIDIDENKKPDIVENIVNYKFDETFDFVMAFEIFEHIPYEEFIKSLKNININTNYIFLSLPLLKKKIFQFKILLPIIHYVEFNIFINKNKITTKNHFWEIGEKSIKIKKLKNDIQKSNYSIEKEITVDAYKYFVLKTQN